MLRVPGRDREEPWAKPAGLLPSLLPAAVAAGLGLWSLGFGLPFLFRPDEDVMVGDAARMAAQGSLDPQFANYPPLVFYVFAAVLKLVGTPAGPTVADPSRDYLAARLVSAAAFAGAALLTFLAGRRAYGTLPGLLAGLALAVAPLAVRQAHFATVDMVETGLVAGALCAAAHARTWRGLAVAGALCGLAAAAKYPGGLALVAVGAVGWRSPGRRRIWVAAAAAAIAFAVPCAVVLQHPAAYLGGLGFLLHRGYAQPRQLPIGLVFHALVTLPFGLGPGTLALALVGIGVAAWRREPLDVGLLLFAGTFYAVHGLGKEDFFRYLLPLLPALSLLAGGALRALPGPALGPALAGCLLLLLPAISTSLSTDRLLGRQDTRQQAADWIVANVPTGASIASPYYGGPFYSTAQIDQNRFFPPGSPAAAFAQGRYTGRYRINGPAPGYRVLASGPPEQAPTPRAPFGTVPVASFVAGRAGAVYDPLDAFYLPIWRLDRVQRPGPSILIVRVA